MCNCVCESFTLSTQTELVGALRAAQSTSEYVIRFLHVADVVVTHTRTVSVDKRFGFAKRAKHQCC